jgi:type IV pilus assembly protein PilO
MMQDQQLNTLWVENRGKVLVLLVLILLCGLLYGWRIFLVDPELVATKQDLNRLEIELRQQRQRIDEGGGADIAGLAVELQNFYQQVPQPEGLGDFIGQLYQLATDAGIDIDQVSYAIKTLEELPLFAYQLSFSVSGEYRELKKFIHLLENSPSLIIVDQITLDSAGQKATGSVRLQIQVQTFFREATS